MESDGVSNRIIYVKCPYHDQKPSTITESVLQACILLAMGWILVTVFQGNNQKMHELTLVQTHSTTLQAHYHLKQAPAETKSRPWKNDTNAMQLKTILRRLLKKHKFNVLCMHHVEEMEVPYRACMVANRPTTQYYLLLNPQVVGHSQTSMALQQSSVACKKPFQSRRYKTIFVEWSQHQAIDHKLYARFDDETAIELQIAMDEFKGSFHCGGGGGVPTALQSKTNTERIGTHA